MRCAIYLISGCEYSHQTAAFNFPPSSLHRHSPGGHDGATPAADRCTVDELDLDLASGARAGRGVTEGGGGLVGWGDMGGGGERRPSEGEQGLDLDPASGARGGGGARGGVD